MMNSLSSLGSFIPTFPSNDNISCRIIHMMKGRITAQQQKVKKRIKRLLEWNESGSIKK